MIDKFSGPYRFLSNFYAYPVMYEDIIYPTAEHAYQATKTRNQKVRKIVAELSSPAKAKLLGGALRLREDWEDVKVPIMEQIVLIKFSNEAMAEMLLSTEDQELAEGNYWGDKFWGVYYGEGRNELGKILMNTRKILRSRVYGEMDIT